MQTAPTALGVALGAKPTLRAGRQASNTLGAMQARMIANANAPRTLNTGFRGQRGAINPSDFNLITNPDGTVTLYHGTTNESAKKIIQDKKLLSAGEPDVYMTTDPMAGYGDGTVVQLNIDPKHLFLDDEFPSGRVDFRMPSVKGWRIQQPKIYEKGGNNKAMSQRPLTEFEQAHLIAQRNAALPVSQGGLGLAPNNTAMDRARALGFDVDNPMYHGTNQDINEFLTSGKGKTTNSGAFFTDNPSVASTYSDSKTGVLYPVLLKNGEVVNVEANGSNWNWLKKNIKITSEKTKERKAINKNLGKLFADDFKYNDALSTDDLASWAKSQGFDSIKFNQVKDRGPQGVFANEQSSMPSNNAAIFNPKNIRSRFAAFDPMKKESSNLLAQFGALAPTATMAAYLYNKERNKGGKQ